MRVAAVIPARMQSTRLPGKPLVEIGGVPMIVRVLDRARACPRLSRIVVATDSEEIRRAIREAGGEARMTSPHHRTGSDRVAEVAAQLDEEMVLNLQGDEPLMPVSTLNGLIDFAAAHPDITVVTPRIPLTDDRAIADPNVVKVVTAPDGRALYFSRLPIPFSKAAATTSPGHFKHIGMYLFRREFLLRFVSLPTTPLERSESLEQLRILEHGYPVWVVDATEDSVSVDTPEDLALVRSILTHDTR